MSDGVEKLIQEQEQKMIDWKNSHLKFARECIEKDREKGKLPQAEEYNFLLSEFQEQIEASFCPWVRRLIEEGQVPEEDGNKLMAFAYKQAIAILKKEIEELCSC